MSVVRIKTVVETGFAGCTHTDVIEIDKDEWDAMTEQQREDRLDQEATDFRDNLISCSAWVLDGDERA